MPVDANQILPLGPLAHNNDAQLDGIAADAEELRTEDEKGSGSRTACGGREEDFPHSSTRGLELKKKPSIVDADAKQVKSLLMGTKYCSQGR